MDTVLSVYNLENSETKQSLCEDITKFIQKTIHLQETQDLLCVALLFNRMEISKLTFNELVTEYFGSLEQYQQLAEKFATLKLSFCDVQDDVLQFWCKDCDLQKTNQLICEKCFRNDPRAPVKPTNPTNRDSQLSEIFVPPRLHTHSHAQPCTNKHTRPPLTEGASLQPVLRAALSFDGKLTALLLR